MLTLYLHDRKVEKPLGTGAMLEATRVGEVILGVSPELHPRLLIAVRVDRDKVVGRRLSNRTTHTFGRDGNWRESSDGETCRLLSAKPLSEAEAKIIKSLDRRHRKAKNLQGLKLYPKEIALLIDVTKRYGRAEDHVARVLFHFTAGQG